MKPKLSASALKHEAFVLALLSGLTAADAARKAGYGRKNINVRIVAWELLQREDVQARLEQLRQKTNNEKVMTLVQMKVRLSEIARASYDSPDRDGDPIKAIDILCRLDGLYRQKGAQVNVPPISNVAVVEAVRSKISARVEHQEDNTIESDDMSGSLGDSCSEEQDTKNSEVADGTRKSGAISPAQIG